LICLGEYLNNNCNSGGGGYYQGGGENIGGDLFIGSSGKGRQIFAHNIDINSISSHQNMPLNNSDGIDTNDNYSKWAMLSAGSSFGGSSSVCWDITGLPIVERSSDACIVGFDLISCPSGRFTKSDDDINVDNENNENEEEENKGLENEAISKEKENINRIIGELDKEICPYDAILFHQSSIGDVYAQRMVYPNYNLTKERNNNKSNIKMKSKVFKMDNGTVKKFNSNSRTRSGTLSTSSNSSNSSSSNSDNNDSENESSSSDDVKTSSGFGKRSKPNNNNQSKSTNILNTTANNVIKKTIDENPPIQMNLPCGIRGDVAIFDSKEHVPFNGGGLIGNINVAHQVFLSNQLSIFLSP
jgi:hypothetical protein